MKIFEPITLFKAIALLPFNAASILTAASGALVPNATTVSPITTDGTFNFLATPEAPSTKKLAPPTRHIKPIISQIYTIKIFLYKFILNTDIISIY